ncbi:MAG: mRNA surveillance protein pelota [Candidatus Methanomethylophilaceae archaeon]
MRVLEQNRTPDGIIVQIETDDDIWHLFNVIETSDLVTASTTRREERIADKIRAERAEKRRMTLGIRVEKIEFSDSDLRLKILGVIENGPQDIGQHHTLIIEVGDRLTIQKTRWKRTQLERLERAVKDTAKPRIVFVSLDQDEATIAVMRQYGLKEIANIRSMRSGKQYVEKENGNDYHGEIIEKLKPLVEEDMPLVLLGPGFEKELLADSVKQKDAALSSNAYVYHTGQSGMQGINELMKKGIGTDVLRKSRVGIEMEAVENLMEEIGKDGLATYGTVEVSNAAAAGAVRTLLILDSKLRDGDYDRMVRDTESQKGNVVVVSEQHDAGKELGALGGFAALLRYKIP